MEMDPSTSFPRRGIASSLSSESLSALSYSSSSSSLLRTLPLTSSLNSLSSYKSASRLNAQQDTELLIAYLDEAYPLCSNREEKQIAVDAFTSCCQAWVHHMQTSRELPLCDIQVFAFGSFRLNVSQNEDDVDLSVVIPGHGISHPDCFTSFVTWLETQPSVTSLISIANAYVPLIKVTWNGVSLDVVFAFLPHHTLVGDILEDEILQGLDPKSVVGLNGPRVTETLLYLVEDHLPTFQLVLRGLRHWAKSHGVYNNKLGFLGGVNYAIVAAFAVQLFGASSSPSVVLERAWSLLAEWKWPHPFQVCEVVRKRRGFRRRLWRFAVSVGNRAEVMPILTPVKPVTNSALVVTSHTRQIMIDELIHSLTLKEQGEDWREVFSKSTTSFGHRFPTFLVITAKPTKSFCLFVESRLRRYCNQLEQSISLVYPYPCSFQSNANADDEVWVIGLELKPEEQFDVTQVTTTFCDECLREARTGKERVIVEVYSQAKLAQAIPNLFDERDGVA